jgi:CheY-like chemotaxis protein
MNDPADSHKDSYPDVPTALVIEDEAIVRKLIRRMLEPEICRVIEADSGEEGLRIIQHGVPPIDIVLTDLTMPGLNGYAVFEVLTRYRPDLPVGVISGYGGVATTQAQGLGARFLLKPFTGSALIGLVSALIADERAMRAQAGSQRARTERARKINVRIEQQEVPTQPRLDLVAAAWELHHRLHMGDEPSGLPQRRRRTRGNDAGGARSG